MKAYDEIRRLQSDEIEEGPQQQMRRILAVLGRLRSEKRRRLLEILDGQPGLNIDELAKALGVRRTAAIHHIRRLEKQINIVRVRQGRHLLHFLGSLPPMQRAAICLSRVPSIRSIIDDLAQHPRYSQQDVAERVGVTRRTVRRAIRRLVQGRLVELVPSMDERSVSVRLSPQLGSLGAGASNPVTPMPITNVPVDLHLRTPFAAVAGTGPSP